MKKLKPYILTSSIVLGIFLIVFAVKGIFPFGDSSLIWGDMHDQITAFYYHFYDSFRGSNSLFVNFSTSGGINFIGILAYYILSPFSFITLLFPRDQIYLVVSIIVALKILTASLTCLYFIRKYFNNIPALLSVLLAIIYAFSGYSLAMYQITPWIDLMYLFPLLVIGLKKVLDLEKPTLYITILAISLITSFYVSIMVVIFIFFSSLFYLLVYKDKEERKKGIVALGLTTVISLLLSLFIIIPSYLQISISSRMGFSWQEILNSKTGPITDKVSMFMFGGIMYVGLILLFRNFKKNKRFITWYIPTSLILLIPVIIEPINKIWHFGSYAFFPYRAGFIMMFLLIIGACYGIEHCSKKQKNPTIGEKITVLITTLITSAIIIYLTYEYYDSFQIALETLTISVNHSLLWMLLFTTLSSFIGCFIIFLIHKKLNNFSLILISIITLTHITCNSFLYLGIDREQEVLMQQYVDLQKLEKSYQKGDYYRVKNIIPSYMMNSGMVMRYHTLDHFTSLTDKSNLESLKKLGYSSMWVKTYSKGGTLFTDSLLANKYLMSVEKIDDNYHQYLNKYGDLFFYQSKTDPSYGYFLDNNVNIMDQENSFMIQNDIYKAITKNNHNLFTIEDDFVLHNIKKTKEAEKISYQILDKDAYNYLEKNITVTGNERIYLEILKDLDNNINSSIYQKFNIYINDHLFRQKALTENDNGVIDLGNYKDEEVNIKIELVDDVLLDNITIGIMDNEKYNKFMVNEKINTKINYSTNKIKVEVESDEEKLLFLPIAYNDGYKATVNGKTQNIIKVFDNYIGVMVSPGENNITLSFIPKGFIISTLISFITLIGTIFLIRKNWYQNIIEIKWLQNIAYISYLGIYIILVFLIYFILTICYLMSYFVYFNV